MHAASVNPEPGSNSHEKYFAYYFYSSSYSIIKALFDSSSSFTLTLSVNAWFKFYPNLYIDRIIFKVTQIKLI